MSDLTLIIEFKAPVHHGSGFGLAGLVDRTILRDSRGMPYLSGAALKGKFRFAAWQILNTRDPERSCGRVPGSFCSECAVCRLFGTPRLAGELTFLDAYPSEVEKGAIAAAMATGQRLDQGQASNIRSTTSIDRLRQIALSGRLFTTEALPTTVGFGAGIRFACFPPGSTNEQLRQLEHRRRSDRELLRECATVMTHFGAGSARGTGFCRFEIEPAGEEGTTDVDAAGV